jgi:hypothetical protein
MAKKKNEDTGQVTKYTLRFIIDVTDKKGNVEHKKNSVVTCGPEAYAIYNSLGVVEVVSTKAK